MPRPTPGLCAQSLAQLEAHNTLLGADLQGSRGEVAQLRVRGVGWGDVGKGGGRPVF